jgi:hypothetical protein
MKSHRFFLPLIIVFAILLNSSCGVKNSEGHAYYDSADDLQKICALIESYEYKEPLTDEYKLLKAKLRSTRYSHQIVVCKPHIFFKINSPAIDINHAIVFTRSTLKLDDLFGCKDLPVLSARSCIGACFQAG